MAQKFHINPETGNANVCRATKNPCRFGDAPHYDSREAAQEAYEISQGDLFTDVERKRDVVLDTNGYLREDFAALAAPRGVSCPHCGEPSDYRAASQLISNEFVSCRGCGKRYDLYDVKVELTPDNPSYKFLKKSEVLKATWYHATNQEEWLSEIEDDGTDFEAHMGTEAAAFDRALTEYAFHGSFAKPFYLYEVSLAEDSEIADEVADDENGKLLDSQEGDVVRYINRWEDMASISLAVKPEKIVIKSKRLVTAAEAHRRISPYNVLPESMREDEESSYESDLNQSYPQDNPDVLTEEDERLADLFEQALERRLAFSATID